MNTNQTTKAEELAKPDAADIKQFIEKIEALKRGNTQLIEALYSMVEQFFYEQPDGLISHAFMSAEEFAIKTLIDAGVAEKVDTNRFRLLSDALDARLEITQPAPAVPDEFRRLVHDIDDLIANSGGVSGLHLNGDIAPWSELLVGGRFEEWLMCLDDARAMLAATPQPPDQSQADQFFSMKRAEVERDMNRGSRLSAHRFSVDAPQLLPTSDEDRGVINQRIADAKSPAVSADGIGAEIRSLRDFTGEYENYLVITSYGDSMPYMRIPEGIAECVLDRVMSKLNSADDRDEQIADMRHEIEYMHSVLSRYSDLLRGVAAVLKGKPDELMAHDLSDLPALCASLNLRIKDAENCANEYACSVESLEVECAQLNEQIAELRRQVFSYESMVADRDELLEKLRKLLERIAQYPMKREDELSVPFIRGMARAMLKSIRNDDGGVTGSDLIGGES